MRYIFALWKPNGKVPTRGADYSPEWAERLVKSIKKHDPDAEFACVTDYHPEDMPPEVECHELLYAERDWSSMMECYRPEVVGKKALLVGLDTIAVGPMQKLGEHITDDDVCHIMPLDPYHRPLVCNGVVGVNYPTAQTIWFSWAADRAQGALEDGKYFMFGKFSEMVWLRHNARPTELWDNIEPNKVVSYKVHVSTGFVDVDEAYAVYFHGEPKPNHVAHAWIKEAWS